MHNQTLSTPEVDSREGTRTAELSIVIPTFNEIDNVSEIISRLDACLQDVSWEAIFVDDDSPDGTADRVREIARRDQRIRCVQRIGRRGLSSACTEGLLASSAPYLAIMDADGQHDETVLPQMLEILKSTDMDIVVGSRYVDGGGIGNWNESRAKMSRFATRLSQLVIKQELCDPMSGFFAFRRDVVNLSVRGLSNLGFKILVDLLASSTRPLKVKEVPYEFRNRLAGESKLDSQAMWDYSMLLMDKLVGRVVPIRFVSFALVGWVGVLIHFLILTVLFRLGGTSFAVGQLTASAVAMISNFGLNNALTFRDKRLKGWRWAKGLVLFMLVCGIGAAANVGIASYLFIQDGMWVIAALAGVAVGAVWNYAVSGIYTWGTNKTR